MSGDFFDPTPEQQVVVLVESATLRQAERLIESCEHCNEEGAEIPFDNILDRVTASDPSVTDYESPNTNARTIHPGYEVRGILQQNFALRALGYASSDHECNIVALLAAAELRDSGD